MKERLLTLLSQPRPHPRDQSTLALAIDDFFYEADAFWSNDDLFIYMNELEYVEDGSS
jgi:hypothetical protein